MRKKKLSQYLLLSILLAIFREQMTSYNQLSPDMPFEFPQLNNEDATFYERQWWEYGKRICADLQILYKIILRQIETIITNQNGVNCYSEAFVAIIREEIVKLLDEEKTWTDNLSSANANCLYIAYKNIKKRVTMPFLDEGDTVIDVFEEPVADCFMVKMQGLSPSEYLNMVIDEAWYTWNQTSRDRSDENFIQYITSDILRHRILSVTYAMIEEKVEEKTNGIQDPNEKLQVSMKTRKEQKELLFRNGIRFGDKKMARATFQGMYEEQEAMMCDTRTIDNLDVFIEYMLNPQKIISEYISTVVFKHNHFDEVTNVPLQTYVQEIKKLIRALNILV